MAGYIFNLDSVDAVRRCAEHGLYSTRIPAPRSNQWAAPAEGTLADFVTMRPGDNVYFFVKRQIRGVGQMVRLDESCRFANYPSASLPNMVEYEDVSDKALDSSGEGTENHRWVCAFEPAPRFFLDGVDMDDALASNPPAFRSLRAMWKRSFVKLDDEENQALKDAILKRNQLAIEKPTDNGDAYPVRHSQTHAAAKRRLQSDDYSLDIPAVLLSCNDGDQLRHEMALEAGLLSQLADCQPATARVFGRWDFLSHQTIASPFKPVDYMDRMDVFGYAFIPGYRPTISRYLVAELKRDVGTAEDVGQVLKYVDWVRDEYAHGDYSMIRAFLVAYDFDDSASDYVREFASRHYTVERRPARTEEWQALSLVRYRLEPETGVIRFSGVEAH